MTIMCCQESRKKRVENLNHSELLQGPLKYWGGHPQSSQLSSQWERNKQIQSIFLSGTWQWEEEEREAAERGLTVRNILSFLRYTPEEGCVRERGGCKRQWRQTERQGFLPSRTRRYLPHVSMSFFALALFWVLLLIKM